MKCESKGASLKRVFMILLRKCKRCGKTGRAGLGERKSKSGIGDANVSHLKSGRYCSKKRNSRSRGRSVSRNSANWSGGSGTRGSVEGEGVGPGSGGPGNSIPLSACGTGGDWRNAFWEGSDELRGPTATTATTSSLVSGLPPRPSSTTDSVPCGKGWRGLLRQPEDGGTLPVVS